LYTKAIPIIPITTKPKNVADKPIVLSKIGKRFTIHKQKENCFLSNPIFAFTRFFEMKIPEKQRYTSEYRDKVYIMRLHTSCLRFQTLCQKLPNILQFVHNHFIGGNENEKIR
jgi:hypothetical protein